MQDLGRAYHASGSSDRRRSRWWDTRGQAPRWRKSWSRHRTKVLRCLHERRSQGEMVERFGHGVQWPISLKGVASTAPSVYIVDMRLHQTTGTRRPRDTKLRDRSLVISLGIDPQPSAERLQPRTHTHTTSQSCHHTFPGRNEPPPIVVDHISSSKYIA